MRRSSRFYSGSALLSSAVQRLLVATVVALGMWLLTFWALGWL